MIKLFSPAEDYTQFKEITEAEVDALEWAAKRLQVDFAYNKEQGKCYFGHRPGYKKPKPVEKLKPIIPPGGAKKWASDGKAYVKVLPIAQNLSDSCGATSVAIVVNALRPNQSEFARINDIDVKSRYGYDLVLALKKELPEYDWAAPDFNRNQWESIERKIDSGLPVIFSANGLEFSPSGHGHIMVIYGINGDQVHIADPNGGYARTTTKQKIEHSAQHAPYPGGNWIIWATPKPKNDK